MAQYVLGDEGARKFKQLTTAKLESVSKVIHSGEHGIDNYYATPFQIQWAQSSGEKKADGTYQGTYIIWLPNGCLKVNNIFKEKWECRPAANYNTEESGFGWFDLESMLKTVDSPWQEWPSEFSIWLDYSGETVSFHFNDSLVSELSRRILVAKVKNYNTIQTINSSIVISDANMPFDIIKWHHESTLDKPVIRMVRNWFYANQINQELPDVDVPTGLSSLYNIYLVNNLTINYSSHEMSSDYAIEFTEGLSSVPESPEKPEDANMRKFKTYKKLYSYSGYDGTVLYDCRNAVVEFEDFGIDNNTISYGEDGECLKFLHLNNFYNLCADIDSIGSDDKILIRKGEKLDAKLCYSSLTALTKSLSNELSNLSGGVLVDDASISKGQDGELSGILHLNDFHNEKSNTTTMANSDIVLRTPYKNDLSAVCNKLEYMPFDQFEEMMDTWINSAIEAALEDGGSIADHVDKELSGLSATGGSGGMFAWDEETRTIGAGGCMVGRQWYSAQNTGSNKADGLYSVVVTLNSSGSVFVGVVSNATLGQAPTATQCWIPIYQITDGKIAIDYRGAFVVPVYE